MPSRAWVALWLAGCGVSEQACNDACARPFALVREEASVQVAAWRGIPEPQRAQAMAVHAAWATEADAAQAAFVAQCVPVCRRRPAAVVECLQKARNSGEWKACGKS